MPQADRRITTEILAGDAQSARAFEPNRKREPKPEPEPSRFDQAIDRLSHVVTRPRGQGRDFWHIGQPVEDRQGHYRFLADYALDCDLGRALGENFLKVLRLFPDEAGMLTELTLKSIAKAGRLTGVEVAFLNQVAALVAAGVRATAVPALQVIEARVRQADGRWGIYRNE